MVAPGLIPYYLAFRVYSNFKLTNNHSVFNEELLKKKKTTFYYLSKKNLNEISKYGFKNLNTKNIKTFAGYNLYVREDLPRKS